MAPLLILEFLDSATVDVHTFAAFRRAAADLTDDVRAALYRAWRLQLVADEGPCPASATTPGPPS